MFNCFIFLDCQDFSDFIYIYIHHIGQFLQFDVRNSLTRVTDPVGTTFLNLELLIAQSLSTPSNPCNGNASAYDNCFWNQYMDQLVQTNSCLLPFLAQPPGKKVSYCNNYDNSMTSLQYFQNISSLCLTSCLHVIPDLTLQLEDQYLANKLRLFSLAREQRSLYLLLPTEVNLIESSNYYTLFTALSDFLGIACLFFGISAFGLADILVRTFTVAAKTICHKISLCKEIKTSSMVVQGLIYFPLVLLILYVYLSKYISFPKETNVALVTNRPQMSMALCRSKYVVNYVSGSEGFNSVSENLSFWQDGVDIRKKVFNLSVMNSVGEWSLVWDVSKPESKDADIFYTTIFPLDNETLQFCEILDLQQFQDLTKVRKTIFYFHLKFVLICP